MAVYATKEYERWFRKLRDYQARVRIDSRIRELDETGNAGDVEPVGEGVSELRFHFGPGYRVYYQRRGEDIILLLLGGDKSSQSDDIAKAKRLAKG